MSFITDEKKVKIRKMGHSSYLMMSRYGFSVGDIVDVSKSDDDTLIIKRVKKGGEDEEII